MKASGASGLGANFSQNGLTKCQIYYFRAKATSFVYPGAWSEAIEVKTKCPGPVISTELPGKIAMVRAVATQNCGIKFTWATPGDKSLVTGYKLQVSDRADSFHDVELCGSNSATTCTVPMDVFANKPFSLKTGDYIVVRGSAISAVGQGPYSV